MINELKFQEMVSTSLFFHHEMKIINLILQIVETNKTNQTFDKFMNSMNHFTFLHL